MTEVAYEQLVTIDRDVFVRDYWDYRPGEHVTILGPTGQGKTTLGFELLNATARKDLQAYILVSKPRDETFELWKKKMRGFKVIETFPPDPVLLKRYKPRGYFLQPYQSLKNLKEDKARLTREFRKCIMDCYASREARIVFSDETTELARRLGLSEELEALWQRGRSLKAGLWALGQRSAHNPLDMYNAPEHLFLFSDPDKRNRIRFSEIGGVNPDTVMQVTDELPQYHVLYIKRTGRHMCIVSP